MEPVESRSNSHRKTSILRTRLEWTIAMADSFLASREKFKPNLPRYSGHPIFFCEKIKVDSYSIFKSFYLITSLLFYYSSHISLFSESLRISRIS